MNKQQLAHIADAVEVCTGRRTMFVTVSEFAEITGQHPKTVRNLCARGEITARQPVKNSPYKIPIQQLAPYLLGATNAA